MKSKYVCTLFLLLATMLMLLLVACQRQGEPVTEEQVRSMAESALLGLNDDNYDAWTAHFGTMMKAAVPRDVFTTVRDSVLAGVGAFESIEGITSEPAQTEGHTRWIVTGNFEQGQLRLIYVIPNDGNRIEGVTFEEVS